MNCIPSAVATATIVAIIILSTVSLMSIHTVFADSYKKSQATSQTNGCGKD